jgi:hypothetical protein
MKLIKQLICWFKTEHENKELIGSNLIPTSKSGYSGIIILERTYKCTDCGSVSIKVDEI